MEGVRGFSAMGLFTSFVMLVMDNPNGILIRTFLVSILILINFAAKIKKDLDGVTSACT